MTCMYLICFCSFSERSEICLCVHVCAKMNVASFKFDFILAICDLLETVQKLITDFIRYCDCLYKQKRQNFSDLVN